MKKTLFILTMILLLLVSSLASTSAQDEEITLRLWAHQEGAFNASTQALIDAYMAEHPNVTIEMEVFEYDLYIQTLQTALPAGDEADILALFGTWTCSYADRLAPAPEGVSTDVFFPAPVTGYICDDTLYGLPQESNVEYGAVLVNKAMFEEAGLAYPPAWATWDDLIADASALTKVEDGQMTVAGYHFTNADAIAFSFLAGILQRGGSYWNEDQSQFTFNTDEARATLEQMVALVEAGVVDPVLFNDTANWGGNAFFTNQSAIVLIGPWAVAYSADFSDFGEFGYVALPSIGESPNFAADSGWGLTVAESSEHSDVAWDFIQFATTNEANALQWNIGSGTIPALRSLVEDEANQTALLTAQPWLESVLPMLEFGQYLGNMPDRDLVMYDILYPYILETLQGVMSVDEALEFIEFDANDTFQ